ncbi:MAG: NIL domain-containing protein [Anaerolineales bacterium]|jgi:ABC-type methionine transport system ATPase subunit
MADQDIRLNYPQELLREPVVNQLIRRYDLTVNILQARIGNGGRWMKVRLSGNQSDINQAISWLESLGLKIEF